MNNELRVELHDIAYGIAQELINSNEYANNSDYFNTTDYHVQLRNLINEYSFNNVNEANFVHQMVEDMIDEETERDVNNIPLQNIINRYNNNLYRPPENNINNLSPRVTPETPPRNSNGIQGTSQATTIISPQTPVEIPEAVLEAIPDAILSIITCPISLDIMRDPVINSVGRTYERNSIQAVIDREIISLDPETRQPITRNLIPNYSIRSLIRVYIPQLGGKRKLTKKTKQKKIKNNKKTKHKKIRHNSRNTKRK